VNGKLKKVAKVKIEPAAGRLLIGHSKPEEPELQGWNGQLDEVSLYDRALSDDEVWKLYESSGSGQ